MYNAKEACSELIATEAVATKTLDHSEQNLSSVLKEFSTEPDSIP